MEDRPAPAGPRRTPWAAGLAVAMAIGLVVFLSAIVLAREGNLAWDDADYLRSGLEVSNASRTGGPVKGIARWLAVRPKPPLLVGWIAAGATILGRDDIRPLLVWASVVPFALLLGAAAWVAGKLHGPRASPLAVACLAASPMALAFGAKVMVETFMGLWTLLALASAASLLDRPSVGRGFRLGLTLGAALLTKLTVALLFPAPLAFLLIQYVRRHPRDREMLRVGLAVAAGALIVAGPWYARNGGSAVKFAFFSARYNIEALGRPDVVPRLDRVRSLIENLPGWILLGSLPVAALLALGRPRRDGTSESSANGAQSDFAALASLGAVSGALVLMVPPYFDPRFLLPIWPCLAVLTGGLLARWTARSGPLRAAPVFALLLWAIAASASALVAEPTNSTYWKARDLIDELVAKYGVARVANVGNSIDWNVCKTGLMNELRRDPRDCHVLHDLSRLPPEEVERRVPRLDAVIVLDPNALPPGFLDGAPGLNRAYGAIGDALARNPEFRRVETIATGLPAMSVYVRRR